jgi:hypothetical protein
MLHKSSQFSTKLYWIWKETGKCVETGIGFNKDKNKFMNMLKELKENIIAMN